MKRKIVELRNPAQIANQMAKEKSRRTGRLQLGGLYSFYYDPKHAGTLPYYDIFPMVLVLDKHNDGFLGLNLHYLPFNYRVAFLNKLMDYAVLDDERNPERLKVTYDILSASKRLKEFRPCLKKYLYSHVQSHLLTIEPHEWEVAVSLPLQRFVKSSAGTVWQESIEEIRK